MAESSRELMLRLERVLGLHLPRVLWGEARSLSSFTAAQEGTGTFADWVADVEELLDASFPPSPAAGKRPVMLHPISREDLGTVSLTSLEALSHYVAHMASEDEEVQKFRETPGLQPLLRWEGVNKWVTDQLGFGASGGLGRQAWWLKDLPLPQDVADALQRARDQGRPEDLPNPLVLSYSVDEVLTHAGPRQLEYAVPEQVVVVRVNIPKPDSPLNSLRLLSMRLADEYAWTEAAAAVFTLTGRVPAIARFYAEAHFYAEAQVKLRLPALQRLVLTVDPALGPKEEAEQYSELRAPYIGQRHREMTPKGVTLALFAGTRPPGESWADTMEDWNRIQSEPHPDWVYQLVSNFARDSLDAGRRLVGASAAKRGKADGDGEPRQE